MTLPTLAEMGISLSESFAWQRIAKLPAREFEARIKMTRERGAKVGTRGFLDPAFSSEYNVSYGNSRISIKPAKPGDDG
ncbi:MAG TPA: hypothetical protein VNF29_16300 [Candidatus Binataceae bacterium]|nr:hypothetical protein [Candidatus Binataceae bacterium]